MNMGKSLWFLLGVLLLGIAYLGVITPGIPWSTPCLGATYCFAKSSHRMHACMHNHPLFGAFLTNWQEKRIFPTKAKYLMIITMCSSLLIMWFTTGNVKAMVYTGIFMLLVVIWGWRYPGSEEIYQQRKAAGMKRRELLF